MSELLTTHEAVTIADGVTIIDCFCHNRAEIELSNQTTGTPTAGTLTFRGKKAGAANWQDITDTIDFANYNGVTVIDAALAKLEVTTSGVTGTGLTTELYLAISSV